MMYLVISIIASVAVSILLKISRRHQLVIMQMIGVNYLVAAVLMVLLYHPKFSAASDYYVHWPIFTVLGIAMPLGFFFMAKAVANAGIIKADMAARLSLFLGILAAFFLFGETATTEKIIGIVLAFLSLFLMSGESTNSPKGGYSWMLAVWLTYGAADITFKEVARTGLEFTSYLLIAFIVAAIVTWICVLVKRQRLHLASLGVGVVLGALNFTNIYTYVRAHIALHNQTATVFTTMNVGVIIVSLIAGMLCFHEALSKRNWLGILVAIAAIVMLFNGSHLFAK